MSLCLDGDMPQWEALTSSDAQALLHQMRMAVMKFAAACSGTQQPNDNSKGFLGLHTTLKGKAFQYTAIPEAVCPCYMEQLKAAFVRHTRLNRTQRNILLKFFEHAPTIVSSVFKTATVKTFIHQRSLQL